MFGFVLTGPRCYELRRDLPRPDVRDGEILVRSRVMTLCGSDFPFFRGDAGRDRYPYPPGFPVHETLGEVVESRAEGLREGDVVLAMPKGSEGALEMFVADAGRACAAPRYHEHLVLAQPLGCVLKAARRLSPVSGKVVVVVGQGGIGLLWTQLMRVRGARRIIVLDLNDRRLGVARQVGATDAVNAARDNVVAAVTDLTDGQMADTVIEAVGLPATQGVCIDLAKPGGEVLFFGVPHVAEPAFPFAKFFRKQLVLTSSTSTEARTDFPEAFDLILSRQVRTDPLVTHRLPLSELNAAMALAADGSRTDAVKVLLVADGQSP